MGTHPWAWTYHSIIVQTIVLLAYKNITNANVSILLVTSSVKNTTTTENPRWWTKRENVIFNSPCRLLFKSFKTK